MSEETKQLLIMAGAMTVIFVAAFAAIVFGA